MFWEFDSKKPLRKFYFKSRDDSSCHSIDWTANYDHRAFDFDASNQTGDHKVEPKYMKAKETAQEGIEHVQSAILNVLAHSVVAFFMETLDDV